MEVNEGHNAEIWQEVVAAVVWRRASGELRGRAAGPATGSPELCRAGDFRVVARAFRFVSRAIFKLWRARDSRVVARARSDLCRARHDRVVARGRGLCRAGHKSVWRGD